MNISIDRKFRLARSWSNQELRKISHLYSGAVVNVSAGTDEDKEGSRYYDYFMRAECYEMTNHALGAFRGFQGRDNEHMLDLEAPLPDEFRNRFDVVFNHTTLEHIFDVMQAFRNLCEMTRDTVIVVVPFAQVQHENDGYKDFWRISPTCLRRLFQENGLTIVYEAANDDFNAATYLFFVGSKNPAAWRRHLPCYLEIQEAASWLGDTQRELAYLGEVILSAPRMIWRRLAKHANINPWN